MNKLDCLRFTNMDCVSKLYWLELEMHALPIYHTGILYVVIKFCLLHLGEAR